MKAAIVIMDGLGDLRTGKPTPLEAAETKNIDELVEKGATGVVHPLGRGLVPGSDTAHLAIFGYDFVEEYPGRGPLEALGAGIMLKPGDLAFRTNFATIDQNGIVIDRRAGRIATEEARRLEPLLNFEFEGYEIIFKATTEHRGVLIIRGDNLVPVTDTDPHKTGLPIAKAKALDDSEESKATAELINKLTKEFLRRLKNQKANALLLRGAGLNFSIERFEERWGIKGEMIAGGALYKGVARFVGMKCDDIPGATGDKNTNLKAKAQKALESDADAVFIHVKATDNFSHDGDWEGKRRMIERVDKELIAQIKEDFDLLVVTGDHSTPVSIKKHTGHGVPILFSGTYVRTDNIHKFSEYKAHQGGIGHITGYDVLPMILNYLGKAEKIGS